MPVYARTVVLAALGLLLTAGLTGSPPPTARPGSPELMTTTPGVETFRSVRTYPVVAAPVRLRIPGLHITSRLLRLDRLPDGTVAVPDRADVAGWFEQGPRPGQPGPAVILGHVDSRRGPGIFLDLALAKPGTAVHIDRADRTTVTFRVTGVSRVPKDHFPTALVYAPTLEPTLRLVTCGGTFDRVRRSYRDNVIVFAEPA